MIPVDYTRPQDTEARCANCRNVDGLVLTAKGFRCRGRCEGATWARVVGYVLLLVSGISGRAVPMVFHIYEKKAEAEEALAQAVKRARMHHPSDTYELAHVVRGYEEGGNG